MIRCIDTTAEVTYRNFYPGGSYTAGEYPDPTDGNSPAIDSDGAITYLLRGSGEGADAVRWAVERETDTGNPPKQYLKKACTDPGNSDEMCFVAATANDVADMDADELSEKVYWQLMNLSEVATGSRSSTIALAGTQTNNEYLVDENENRFIKSKYETEGTTTTAVDSVFRHPAGLVDFEMVLENLGGTGAEGKQVKSASSTGGSATELDNIVHIQPGGLFESVKLHVKGTSVVTAGKEGVDNADTNAARKGSNAIFISEAESGWKGPVTVQVSDTSIVQTWASLANGKHASAIRIDMGSTNDKVATVKLDTNGAAGGLRVVSNTTHNSAHSGHTNSVDSSATAGLFDMFSPESPGVLVKYPGGDGSVTVNLKNSIQTAFDSSSGIEVQLAEDTTTTTGTPGPSSSGAYVTTNSPSSDAGIVYDIGENVAIATAGKTSAGIIAEANYKKADGTKVAEPKDFHPFIRIGDAIGSGARGETKIVVSKQITIQDGENSANPSGQGKSHGLLVIATSSDHSDTTDTDHQLHGMTNHPLYGKVWTAHTKRNIEIDVNNLINMFRNGYAVALLGDEGTKNTVRVGLAGRLRSRGQPLATMSNPAAAKNAVLFWKGDDTLSVAGHINGGSVNFGAGIDKLVINGGVVGTLATVGAVFPALRTVTAGSAIDFGDGDDTLELRSGIVKSPISKLENLVKRSDGDAAVGDIEFTEDRAANTMTISNGRLIVSGHVNVGTGTVTVGSAAKLVIDATGASATGTDPGKITAASIDFLGKGASDELVTILSTASTLQDNDVAAAKTNHAWLGTGTQVKVAGEDHTFVAANYADDIKDPDFILKRHVTIDAGAREMDAIDFAGTGEQVLVVSGRADGAVNFNDGDDELRVDGGVLSGDVNMGDGDDTVVVEGNGVLSRDVIMGMDSDDDDTLTLHSGYVDGAITGLETMVKTSNGDATVRDVSFDGSSLTIRAGQLFIEGHVNLGTDADDVVTINGGTIVIVATRAASGIPHGRITAGKVEFKGSSRTVQILATRTSTRDADVQFARQNWLVNSATEVVDGDGLQVSPVFSPLSADPRAPRLSGPSGGGGGAGTASDSDSNSYYALGAVAILWLVLRDDDDCCALVDYESDGATATFAGVKGAEQFRSGGTRAWAKLYSDSSVSSQQGLAVGMDSRIGEHGYFGVSAMPNISGAANTQGLSLNRRTSFEGGRYEAKGGWQKDSMFASVRLSHGEFRGSTSFRNLFEAGGQLGGSFDMSHSHLEVGAGMQLSAGEQMTLVPSLGVYGGSMKQGGHAASNAVLVADVPGYSQSYQGWRAGVQLKSSDWLSISDSTKVRPQLGFNVYRTHTSGPGSLNMNQRDQLGILNFTNKLRVRGLPSTVNAFKAGLSMKNSSGASVKLNYVGYEADGKIQHGAIARMQVRF